jgi:glycosyltransferase involved in cell wall biosynthesis
MRQVIVVGVYVKGDGYPNVTQRITALQHTQGLKVIELNHPFQATARQKGVYGMKAGRWVRFVRAHLLVAIRLPFLARSAVVYVPYPAFGVLLWWSVLPRRCRPARIVADAFISWYDTAVEDRALLATTGIAARLLRRLEARAYRLVDQLLVDTPINREYFIELFALDPAHVKAMPLAIDEAAYCHKPYEPVAGRCTVLFVGTFVPLQGVDVIAAAIRLLDHRADINFRIIGYGQMAPAMEKIIAEYDATRIDWIKDWQSASQVAAEIERADICLGIFGAGAKTQRVWPLKNYAYMSVGRALITGDTTCARHITRDEQTSCFLGIPCADARSLAQSIELLADTPSLRVEYARRARSFYERNLSLQSTQAQLLESLFP